MATPTIPAGHPKIPATISSQDVVAIVSVHHIRASHVNRPSIYAKADILQASNVPGNPPVLAGVNIFLHRHGVQNGYSMGRVMTDPQTQGLLDVYLPGARIAKRQLEVIPDWERDCWRLQSRSETIAIVNGAPIQVSTRRKKENGKQVPSAIFLKQSDLNIVTVQDLQIDIWFLKSVRQVHGSADFVPFSLDPAIQDVADRPEQWARDRFIATSQQISAQTVKVVDRFNGKMAAAKVFQQGNHPQRSRDHEFLAFSKQNVDASIVRYLQTTQIGDLPAIITDLHAGFQSYGALRDDIHKSHPGARFSIASKLALRLFPALAWMHFHGIFHSNVSSDNVLIRLQDGKPKFVLLVGYSAARHTRPGKQMALADMLADAQATMKLVEDCCDIWTFRNGPTRDAQGEHLMQKRTQDLMRQYNSVRRCSIDFVERLGNSPGSAKGVKLTRLQNKLGNDWKSAQHAQQQNLMAREVALLGTTKLKEHIKEWESANPSKDTVYKDYMLLTLGHPVLDSLADSLHVKQWDTMPHEVCSAIKYAGGQVEDPWQTFEVRKTIAIAPTDAERYDQIMSWLATSCEVYAEWREVLEAETEEHFQTDTGVIGQDELEALHSALQTRGRLPASMTAMFGLFADMATVPEHVDEVYHVSYHVPSRMFNITQLQRIATTEQLAQTVVEGTIHCDSFVEVRGDAKVEGCYVPLSLLAKTVEQLGLALLQTPHSAPEMPTFDVADFSHVPPTRIVLARPGMIGFGSMLRTGDQANFLYSRIPENFITPNTFIATYFGDMKVLPELPVGTRTYDRPDHWSKYKTAKEFEASAALSKLDSLKAVHMDMEETLLGKLLSDRERVRDAARPPLKRSVSPTPSPSPKRDRDRTRTPEPQTEVMDVSMSFVRRMEERYQASGNLTQPTQSPSENPSFMNNSFMQRNSALLTVAPNDPTNVNISFTVGDETEGLDDDWKVVGQMLAEMPDEDAEVEGMFGFRVHSNDGESEDGTEMDPGSFSAFLGRREGLSFTSVSGSKSKHGSFQQQQSQLPAIPESPTESWSHIQKPLDVTGTGKGSARGGPPASSRKHARNVSNSSSEGMPSAANPSPRSSIGQHRLAFGSQSGSPFGSTGFSNSFGPKATSTVTSTSIQPGAPSQDSFGGSLSSSFSQGFAPSRPSALNPNRPSQKRPRISPQSAQSSFGIPVNSVPTQPLMDVNASFTHFPGAAPPVTQTSPQPAQVARSFGIGTSSPRVNPPVPIPRTHAPAHASFNSDYPPTEPGSPQVDAPISSGANANASFGSDSSAPHSVYNSAGGAISGFLLGQMGLQGGMDEDMPDTDEGESE